jgi:hypothetical protein
VRIIASLFKQIPLVRVVFANEEVLSAEETLSAFGAEKPHHNKLQYRTDIPQPVAFGACVSVASLRREKRFLR